MKKLFSVLLAIVLVFSLTTVAFAAEAKQDQPNSFTKTYTVAGGTAPAETFNFTAKFVRYEDNEGEADATMTEEKAPAVAVGTAAFTENVTTDGDSKDVSVQIASVADAPLGVYTYVINETVPTNKTAGVTYNSTRVYLVLTVLRDEQSDKHYVAAIHYTDADGYKTGEIVNSYDAGSLTVTKQIEGNMADMDKEFNFTIILKAPEGTVFADVQNTVDNGTVTQTSNTEWKITVALGDDESINITNIPVGTEYTVTEDKDGYTTEHAPSTTGTISATNKEVTDNWTNTLEKDVIDTGINLDSVPFVVVLVLCALAAVLFITKRRKVSE